MRRLKEKIIRCLSCVHVANLEIDIDNIPIPRYNKFISGVVKMSGKSNEKPTGNRLDFIGSSVWAIMENVKLPPNDIGHEYAEIIKNIDVSDEIKRILLKTEYKKYLIGTGLSFVGFITAVVAIVGAGCKCLKHYCNIETKAAKLLADQVS